MKDPFARYREYPHVIVQGPRRNLRRQLLLSDQPPGVAFVIADDVFVAPGIVDRQGDVTDRGRQIVRRRLAARARTSRGRICVVWSPTSCTWIDGEGGMLEGNRPPKGDISNPWLGKHQNIHVEDCHTVKLPDGCAASHLCLRKIGSDLVEVSLGEPIVLADFDEPHVAGLPDPADGLLSASLRLRVPDSYRGVRVAGSSGWRILGPVQPLEGGRILRNPWPDDVRDACVEIAGRHLPKRLTDAAWRAVDPEDADINLVGVLRAA